MNPLRSVSVRFAVGAAALGLVLAACGDDKSDDSTAASAASSPAAAGEVVVEHAWARTSPAGATTGAAYFDLTAGDDDALLGVEVGTDVAAEAQIHEVVPMSSGSAPMSSGSATMSSDMGSAQMTMQQIQRLELPAGQTVSLAPGGYHVMLLDLAKPLEAGEQFDLTLSFEHAESQTVTVTVSDDAP